MKNYLNSEDSESLSTSDSDNFNSQNRDLKSQTRTIFTLFR